MTLVAVADALMDLLPVGEGVVKDDSVTRPGKVLPKRLYCWGRDTAPQRLEEGDGRWPEAVLRLRLLYTLGAKGEPRVVTKSRDVSIALDEAVDAIREAIYGVAKRTPLWWDAYVEQVVFDAVRNDEVRAHGLDVAVRMNVPLELGGS